MKRAPSHPSNRVGAFIKPVRRGHVLGAGRANQMIQVLNALLNARGDGVRITITDSNIVFEVDEQEAAGTGNLNWEGEWSSAIAYSTGDIVIRKKNDDIDDGTVAGTYVAITSVAAGLAAPTHGDGRWELLAKGFWRKLLIKNSATDLTTIEGARVRLGPWTDSGDVDIRASEANGKTIKLRELDVCEDGVPKKRMFLCSEAYVAA